jgi:hypothetical protein
MGKLNLTAASIIGAAFFTWNGLLALGQLPDNKYTHWVTVALTAAQMFITKLAYDRTNAGTVIPSNVKQFIDQSAVDGRTIDTYHKPDAGPIAVAVSSIPVDPTKGPQSQTEKDQQPNG